MSKEHLSRAAKIRELNTIKATVPGSGFRANDLVVFHGDDDVRFIGPCADAALEAFRSHYAKLQASPPDAVTGTQRKLLRLIPKLAVTTADGVQTLTLRLGEWNAYLEALYAEGVFVTGAPFVHDGTTP